MNVTPDAEAANAQPSLHRLGATATTLLVHVPSHALAANQFLVVVAGRLDASLAVALAISVEAKSSAAL